MLFSSCCDDGPWGIPSMALMQTPIEHGWHPSGYVLLDEVPPPRAPMTNRLDARFCTDDHRVVDHSLSHPPQGRLSTAQRHVA
jgi:hypothetical protein